MPALPAVPKVVRFSFHYTYGEDKDLVTRDFYEYGGTLSPGDLSTWTVAAGLAFSSNLIDHMHTSVSGLDVVAEDLSSATAPTSTAPLPGVGLAAGATLPASASIVISKKIARRYRGGHPRSYLGGWGATNLHDEQTWDPTFLASVLADYNTYVTALQAACPVAASPAVMVNVSYYQGFVNHTFPSGRVRPIPQPRVTPVVDLVNTFVAQSSVGSQRRRNRTAA